MVDISKITEDEIIAAADIIEKVFKKYRTEAEAEFSRLLKGEAHPTHVFIAKKNGQPIGMAACVQTYFSMNVYGICWVAVLEEHRRQGVGANLIQHVEHYIANVMLKGRTGTVILAANLTDYYSKLGYQKQSDPMHDGAFIMSKILNAT